MIRKFTLKGLVDMFDEYNEKEYDKEVTEQIAKIFTKVGFTITEKTEFGYCFMDKDPNSDHIVTIVVSKSPQFSNGLFIFQSFDIVTGEEIPVDDEKVVIMMG